MSNLYVSEVIVDRKLLVKGSRPVLYCDSNESNEIEHYFFPDGGWIVFNSHKYYYPKGAIVHFDHRTNTAIEGTTHATSVEEVSTVSNRRMSKNSGYSRPKESTDPKPNLNDTIYNMNYLYSDIGRPPYNVYESSSLNYLYNTPARNPNDQVVPTQIPVHTNYNYVDTMAASKGTMPSHLSSIINRMPPPVLIGTGFIMPPPVYHQSTPLAHYPIAEAVSNRLNTVVRQQRMMASSVPTVEDSLVVDTDSDDEEITLLPSQNKSTASERCKIPIKTSNTTPPRNDTLPSRPQNYPKYEGSLPPVTDNCHSSDMVCVICFERRIDSVCIPCGHACMCRPCSAIHRDDQTRRNGTVVCPMCKSTITSINNLYI